MNKETLRDLLQPDSHIIIQIVKIIFGVTFKRIFRVTFQMIFKRIFIVTFRVTFQMIFKVTLIC